MQTFWALYDRREDRLLEQTVNPIPGARGEVWSEDGEGVGVMFAHNGGTLMRIQAEHPEAGEVRCFLRAGSGVWVESVCPNGAGAYVWTRKRIVPVTCDIRIGDQRFEIEATGIEDESAGYHPRHTVWSWSAGAGTLTDGRSVGWNLVEGVNDPPERSERAIWVEGEPFEPAPVEFDGLEAVAVRRRLAARVRGGGRTRRERGSPPGEGQLPPAVRHLRGEPARWARARARPRRHGAPRRAVVTAQPG